MLRRLNRAEKIAIIGVLWVLAGVSVAASLANDNAYYTVNAVGDDVQRGVVNQVLYDAMFVAYMVLCVCYLRMSSKFDADMVGYRGLVAADFRRHQPQAPANQHLRVVGQQHQALQQDLHQLLHDQIEQESARRPGAAAAA